LNRFAANDVNAPGALTSFAAKMKVMSAPEFSHYPSLPPPVRLRLVEMTEHPCPYLPGRLARSRGFWAEEMPDDLYIDFMDASFRRSGHVVYQPVCRGCRACVSLRVPVDRFQPSKSQRRCWRRNQDLTVDIAAPALTDEKFELYSRYMRHWHGSAESQTLEGLESFLYQSPVTSVEFCYRDATGRLLAVGICDTAATALSSVYFFFEPEAADRGLGTLGALKEIDFARASGQAYYYLGYWIDGCGAMRYKSQYRPFQLLGTDGVWRDG
jgi:arginyl-tRNA--protein-N-Asp/Glu arginylyltransferase